MIKETLGTLYESKWVWFGAKLIFAFLYSEVLSPSHFMSGMSLRCQIQISPKDSFFASNSLSSFVSKSVFFTKWKNYCYSTRVLAKDAFYRSFSSEFKAKPETETEVMNIYFCLLPNQKKPVLKKNSLFIVWWRFRLWMKKFQKSSIKSQILDSRC